MRTRLARVRRRLVSEEAVALQCLDLYDPVSEADVECPGRWTVEELESVASWFLS
jgi:hypothetical protein